MRTPDMTGNDIVLPPPCPLGIQPVDLAHADELSGRSLHAARELLDSGGESAPRAACGRGAAVDRAGTAAAAAREPPLRCRRPGKTSPPIDADGGVEPGKQSREDRPPRAATHVVGACAISAGTHAGVVPAHLEAAPRLAGAFVVAVVLLATAAAALALRPRSARAARAASLVLAGLIGAYVASRTTGIPVLSPEPEGLDAVGLTTNAVQAFGLVFALQLNQTRGGHGPPVNEEPTS